MIYSAILRRAGYDTRLIFNDNTRIELIFLFRMWHNQGWRIPYALNYLLIAGGEQMDPYLSQIHEHGRKRKQPCPVFEIVSSNPFATIVVTLNMSPLYRVI